MKQFTVWDRSLTGVLEKCLMTESGDYVGLDTGTLYKKENGYYHSKQHIGIIRNIDDYNKTGMIHLSDDAKADFKRHKMGKMIDCY